MSFDVKVLIGLYGVRSLLEGLRKKAMYLRRAVLRVDNRTSILSNTPQSANYSLVRSVSTAAEDRRQTHCSLIALSKLLCDSAVLRRADNEALATLISIHTNSLEIGRGRIRLSDFGKGTKYGKQTL
jgi:hypothetical protein